MRVSVNLSDGNLKKAKKGDGFMISRDNLDDEGYLFEVNDKLYKSIMKSREKGKGLKFDACTYEYLGIDDNDDYDYNGGSNKGFSFQRVGKAINKASKPIGRKLKARAKEEINIMLDKGEQYANKKIGHIQNVVESELNQLAKKSGSKANKIIDRIGDKIDHKINRMGNKLQSESDKMQRQLNKKLDKAFDLEVDKIVDEETADIEGGKIRWKRRLKKRLKKAGQTVNKAVKPVAKITKPITNAVKDEVKQKLKETKTKLKREASRRAINLGAQAVGTVSNYFIPGSGEIVEEGAKYGIKETVKRVNNKKGGSLVKGSQEAKEKMARLRAMRGKGFKPSGSGFRPSGNGFRPSGSGFMVS